MTAIYLVFANILAANHSGEVKETKLKFDSFGGNLAIKGEATGFFHLEEIDGRHFLITPEGNGYRALGINHFHTMTSKDYDGAIDNIKTWGFNAGYPKTMSFGCYSRAFFYELNHPLPADLRRHNFF